VERITDFLSLAILALIGSFLFKYGIIISAVVSSIFILMIYVITNKNIIVVILKLISKIHFLKSKTENFKQLFKNTESLLKIKPLIFTLFISTISWSFECLGYYLVISHFSSELSLFWSTFSYSFSTIVGAISMLPGGLGVTEGSFLFMLTNSGLSASDSLAIILITRAATLWFAVFLGIGAFLIFSLKFGEISFNKEYS
jgi:uncharacterized protein (TIRG00374 family)